MTFRKVFSCLCLNSNPRNTIRRNISERFLITVALCATKSGVSSITRLFVHWYGHDSTDELHWMRFRSPCCHGFILFERFSPSSVSRSCQCRASVVLDSLLSHPQARLDRCCRHRRSDRLLLRRSDVSEVRLVLTSHVLHGGMRDHVLHCLAVKLLIWTVVAAAAPGCFCRVLIVALILTCFHPLWVPLFPPVVVPLFSLLWVRSFRFFSTLVLVEAAGTYRCFRLSVAPCTTFSLANCSLVCSMLTHVLRVVCWTDKSPCTSLSCSGPLHILQRTRA